MTFDFLNGPAIGGSHADDAAVPVNPPAAQLPGPVAAAQRPDPVQRQWPRSGSSTPAAAAAASPASLGGGGTIRLQARRRRASCRPAPAAWPSTSPPPAPRQRLAHRLSRARKAAQLRRTSTSSPARPGPTTSSSPSTAPATLCIFTLGHHPRHRRPRRLVRRQRQRLPPGHAGPRPATPARPAGGSRTSSVPLGGPCRPTPPPSRSTSRPPTRSRRLPHRLPVRERRRRTRRTSTTGPGRRCRTWSRSSSAPASRSASSAWPRPTSIVDLAGSYGSSGADAHDRRCRIASSTPATGPAAGSAPCRRRRSRSSSAIGGRGRRAGRRDRRRAERDRHRHLRAGLPRRLSRATAPMPTASNLNFVSGRHRGQPRRRHASTAAAGSASRATCGPTSSPTSRAGSPADPGSIRGRRPRPEAAQRVSRRSPAGSR